MSVYSCHSDTVGHSPRGKPTESLMQSGWRVLQRGEIVTREPVMRTVRTDWLPMTCGRLDQIGHTDSNCDGCDNKK